MSSLDVKSYALSLFMLRFVRQTCINSFEVIFFLNLLRRDVLLCRLLARSFDLFLNIIPRRKLLRRYDLLRKFMFDLRALEKPLIDFRSLLLSSQYSAIKSYLTLTSSLPSD